MRARVDQRRDRQVARILGILKALIEGGRPSVHRLAAQFRTRRETIYRDLRALQEIGYPVSRDDDGSLSHPPLFGQPFSPLPGLSNDEVESILWVIKQAEKKEPYHEPLSRVEQKIRLSQIKDKNVNSSEEAVILMESGAKSYKTHQATLLTLVEAIIRKRSCLIEYQPPTPERIWKIQYEPYRLIKTQGGLYSIGWSPSQKRLSTLAVERIHIIELLRQVFTVVPDFDPKKLAEESFGIIWERPVRVVIRFRADHAPYVAERQWHPTQKVRYLKAGRLELSFMAGGTFEITRWILGWGDAAEVISPLKLRKHVAGCLQRAGATYTEFSRKNSP